MKQAAGAIVLAATLLSACGGSGSRPSAEVSRELGAVVAAVRADASRGDVSGAMSELAHLRTQVLQLRAAGRLSAGDATRILDAARQVGTDLPLAAATSSTASTVANVPTSVTNTSTSTTIPTPVTTAHHRRRKHPRAAG